RRARHPGRRPPQGGQRPGGAADRGGAALPARLLQPVAVAGGMAARALPGGRPERPAAHPAARRRRRAGAPGTGAGRGAGAGGAWAVRAYCALTGHPQPEVFHTNEGHAGFLGLERIREYAAQGVSFSEAIELCRAGTVFTTHTPVPAGIDRFARDLVEREFGGTAADPALPLERVLALG